MEQLVIQGGQKLTGQVEIEGAKNAVLPIMAGAILAENQLVTLKNVPVLSDVLMMIDVLKSLNIQVDFDQENHLMTIDATGELNYEAAFEYVSKMRASIVVLGPLLARLGHARVAMPGGCAIGTRPVDLHLKGFEAMGAQITQNHGYIEATCDDLTASAIYLDFPSVGATQNIMMAAALAKGTTTIENVAREPEIVDLANFLNLMGADITGAGTETMKINGVASLNGTTYTIVQDRIEAGTFMIAAAATKGDVLIKDAISEHNRPLLLKLQEMGVTVIENELGVRIIGSDLMKDCQVKTQPYPGFPTDMQAQMTVLQLLSQGMSVMTETVFENRYMHLEELRRMDANYQIKGQSAILYGPAKLMGTKVAASDLRAAAALAIAGLAASGTTYVTNLHYLDRGYYRFHQKLQQLGAKIKRETISE